MFLVSAVKTPFLNLIFYGASTFVHLLLLKFSMALSQFRASEKYFFLPRVIETSLHFVLFQSTANFSFFYSLEFLKVTLHLINAIALYLSLYESLSIYLSNTDQ